MLCTDIRDRVGCGGNQVNDLRKRYFATLGLDPEYQVGDASVPCEAPPEQQAKAALARAHQLRSFEIEHYWKRATYFWAFQVAIFAAFGLLWRQPSANDWSPVTVALAGLGILTAVANTLSARGSRFWQENWENHIDMLEDTIEGRLYKTIWLNNGKVSFSVSRVNIVLSCCFTAFWVLAGAYVAWRFVGAPGDEVFRGRRLLGLPFLRACFVIISIIMILVGVVWLRWQVTNFSASLPNSDGAHGAPIRRCCRLSTRIRDAAAYSFVRRYAADEVPPPSLTSGDSVRHKV